VDADVVAHPAALLDRRAHELALDELHVEGDATVVEEDPIANVHVVRETLVLDRDDAFVGRRVALDERHFGALWQLEPLRERPGADLRAAEILQHGDGLALELGGPAQEGQAGAVLLVGAVREVEPCDVHPGGDEAAQAFERVARGAKGAHELRAAQGHRLDQDRTRASRSDREPDACSAALFDARQWEALRQCPLRATRTASCVSAG